MATTASEKYRGHGVWDTLSLKRESLVAARFDEPALEQWRAEIIEWLDEAAKTRMTRQPSIYVAVLDDLSNALNQLPIEKTAFKAFMSQRGHPSYAYDQLLDAMRGLPLPPPKDLATSYVNLLDVEVEARTARLDALETRVSETETSLQARLDQLAALSKSVDTLAAEIQAQRDAIASVSTTADAEMRSEWQEAYAAWSKEKAETETKNVAQAAQHLGTLAATAKAGEALAEHAAGNLSAADWYQRSKRERKAAQWMRAAALAAFLLAGAVGYYIVSQAIADNFDLTVGDGILRAAVAVVIGAFGALLLREISRHFRESDTAEDVALSLTALGPFYAGSGEDIRHAARVELGDAVLVKNVLSRFSHRDAAKHAAELKGEDLSGLVKDISTALKVADGGVKQP